jgi:hypothetical protein
VLNDTLGGVVGTEGGSSGFGGGNDGRSSIGSRDLGQELALVDRDEKPEPHPLIFLKDPPGMNICCGVVSSGQGVKRFCLQAVIEGTDGCGTGTHRIKAAVAARSWYVKVGIRGNTRAGLLDKRLAQEEILPEDWNLFDTESHAAGDWLSRFQVSRLAKLGSGESLRARTDAGFQPGVGLREYAKTPAKRRRLGDEEAMLDESPSWVDVESEGKGFEDIRSWDPLSSQDEINRLVQENFDLLRKETIKAAVNWSDALGQIRESTKQLMSAQSQTEIRVGTPGAFGASVGVVNAFDGLRHLMELIGDAETKFSAIPYNKLVSLVQRLDQSVVAMGSSDPWATETSELRKMIGETQTNLVLLRDKSVGPLVAMYNYYTDRGHSIPGNWLKDAILSLQSDMTQLKSSAAPGPQPGFGQGQPLGFGYQVHQGAGGSGLSTLEARILAAEKKNSDLEVELMLLKQDRGPSASSPFGATSGGAPFGTSSGGGAGGGESGLSQQFFDDVRNMDVRLEQLEAKSDGNSITIGVRTFRSSRDCETFILQECPGGSLNTFCYDMVSLLN